jgi:hypothetical protein
MVPAAEASHQPASDPGEEDRERHRYRDDHGEPGGAADQRADDQREAPGDREADVRDELVFSRAAEPGDDQRRESAERGE